MLTEDKKIDLLLTQGFGWTIRGEPRVRPLDGFGHGPIVIGDKGKDLVA